MRTFFKSDKFPFTWTIGVINYYIFTKGQDKVLSLKTQGHLQKRACPIRRGGVNTKRKKSRNKG